ncbi:cytochrome P450 9b2-like [Drosophila hydei]|uniref:Cytochrome P450 9b2-like n=1 Tax=Drosophila hydei TaxID=7224 RepID=A0A6J2SXT1_DROHY|nr:cytochrome P450 9b2-like [Drosophila hydei]XP_030080990.1 cytochrome P450 9b2-like [Drosophila hydei]
MELILLLALVGLFYYVYKWTTVRHDEFIVRGLPFEKPLPIFGNNAAVVMSKASFQKLLAEFYARTRQHKLVGFFNFRTPMIQVNDPEIIKKITVKDFDYFPNHQLFFTTEERLVNDMLSVMKDQRWKHMRNTLTPVFTSAKMRSMFGLMNESFAECMDHLDQMSKTAVKPGEGFELELKEVCNRLSNDLIATTAFGLKVSSYKTPDNDFYEIGKSVAFFRGKALYKFMLSTTLPAVFKLLGFKIFDSQKTEFFIRLVVDAMKYREENNIVRPDMIQLLMEAKKESTQQWSDDELVAQCFIFFFAAFENNASLICTTAYELLNNPDIQQRLYEEVKETHDELKGQMLNYDAVTKMKYMDMVVSESLRKWTLAASTDRQCAKDYTLYDDDGSKLFEFKAGDRINIPIVGLHLDDKFFPEPHKFIPERFSDENKDQLVPYTYLPFGVGPRNCIGNRYALMQAKAMLYNLVLKYKIERSPKTVKDLLSDSRGFQLTPQSGYWVHLVPRK